MISEKWDAGSEEPPHSHPGDDATIVIEGKMSVRCKVILYIFLIIDRNFLIAIASSFIRSNFLPRMPRANWSKKVHL